MWDELRLQGEFDRDLKLLLCEMFSRRIVMGFLEVVRAIYFALIGLSPLAIGMLITVGTVFSAFESFIFGPLSDRYGRKLFLILGGVFSTIRLVLYAVSRDFWILAVAQGIGALGEGVGSGQPVVSGYIADKTRAAKRAHVFSVLAISNSVSSTIGALTAALPAYFQASLGVDVVESHVFLFWVGVAMNVLAMFLLIPLRDVERQRKEGSVKPASTFSWRELGKYCVIRSTDGLAFGLISPLSSLFFYLRFGATSADLAPIYAIARFVPVFVYFLVPVFVNRFGDVKGLAVTRIASCGVVLALGFASDFASAAFFFVAYRGIVEFAMPMRQAFASGIVEPSQTGAIIGMSSSLRSLIQAAAPTVAGYLFGVSLFTVPLFAGAVLLAVNGVQYRVFYGGRKSGNAGSTSVAGGSDGTSVC